MGFNDGFSTQGVPFVTASSDGQALVWDSTTKAWVAGTPSGGGLSSVITDGINITGSGTSGDKVRLLPNVTVTTLTASSDVYIGGNLTVSGTTTYINTENVTIKDKNIELATGNSSDVGANNAGITIKGASDKTILWKNDGTGFNFNDGIVVSGKISGSSMSIGTNNSSVNSVAIGINNYATSNGFAHGQESVANGQGSFANGLRVTASGYYSHAEGFETLASNIYAHAEGQYTTASGNSSHAEGLNNKAIGLASHAEGVQAVAYSIGSHAEGQYTIASGTYQHVQGKYNQTSSTALMLVGNGTGTSPSQRSNILEVYTNNIVVSGALNAYNITASMFTGSFIGDASGLINLPELEKLSFDRVIYVNSGSTGVSGSYADPFATIQDALNYANTQYINNESILINIGPGTYTAPSPITRKNTYFKSATSKYEQKAVTIAGAVEVSCSYNAGDMFQKVVGFEGIFFSGHASSPTFKVSTNSYTTYLKNCYISAQSTQNALFLPNTLTTTFGSGSRISIKDSYFQRDSGDTDLIVVNGGSCKFDSIEMGYNTSGPGVAIKQTGGVIQADRVLIDVATTTAAISSSAPSPTTNLFLTNVSLNSSGSANAIINNSNLFIANSYLGNNLNSPPTISGNGVIAYASLTSLGVLPITINGSLKIPLPETFGSTRVNSLSASSGVTGSFVGNGSAITNLSASNWAPNSFASDVQKQLSGSGIISYNTSSGVISTNVTVLTGVATDYNITGSGTSADPVKLKQDISIENAAIQQNLIVHGTASIAFLQTVSQDNLQIGEKYITILSGANTHANAVGSGILWGSGSGGTTVGELGAIAQIIYRSGSAGKPDDVLEIFPGLYVSGSLVTTGDISSDGKFYGDGSGLTSVTASAFPGIVDYAKKVDVSSSFAAFTGSNTFTGRNEFTQLITASAGVSGSFTGSLNGTASYATNADTLDTYHANAFAFTGSNNTFTGVNTFNGPVTASASVTGSFTGSFSGSITSAETATNALKLGGFDAITYARTGSANNFTLNNTFTTLSASQISSSGGITGSFSGSGANIINLTGSNWSGGTGSFFANVRDAFTTGSNVTITTDSGGRYKIDSIGGSGGSSAGSILTYTASYIGAGQTLTAGMIVAVSGTSIYSALNSNEYRSNIIGIVTGTVGQTFNIAIAGEVSASLSGSTQLSGGSIAYLSDKSGSYHNYDSISATRYIVQVGIVGPTQDKIILQPRIFGIKG